MRSRKAETSVLLAGAALICMTATDAVQAQSAPSVQGTEVPRPNSSAEQPVAADVRTPTQTSGERAAPGSSAEIIVTAQRREQTALETPLSLTALDGSLIEQKQVTGLNDLQFAVPGIRSGQQQGVNRVFIRGIGLSSFASGADSSVAFYVDGVYVGRPTEQLSSFFDVQRIEVLRGPQGALYGRNATGGAINLITNDAGRDLGGYLNLSYGSYDLLQGEGAVSLPLSANGDLRARVAFKVVERDGYGYDTTARHPVNDESSQAVRGTLQYNPNSDVNVKATVQYVRESDNNNFVSNFGPYQFDDLSLCPYSNGTECQLQGVAQFDGIEVRESQDAATALFGDTNDREGLNATLNATFALNEVLSLNSITAYREFERHNASNSDGSSVGLGNTFYNEDSSQFSQELVLSLDSGPLQLTGGISYFEEEIDNFVLVPFVEFNLDYIQQGTLDIEAYAAYLQGTYSITPSLRATIAGRYSTEKRGTVGSFTFGTSTPIDDARRWSAFTPKFGLEYDVLPDTMVYGSYTKGFKSGTFNIGQVNPAINPEKIDAYEVGLKSGLFGGTADVTAAYFHYDYSDLQVNKIVGLATLTTNAAAASVDGFEIALSARPTSALSLNVNFNYLDATFSEFLSVNPAFPTEPEEDLSGRMLPGSPKYSGTIGAQYVAQLGTFSELAFNVDAAYQSRVYFSEFNVNQLSQESVTKVNASVKFDSGKDWSVTIWGKNIFDELVSNNRILGVQLWGYPIYGAYDPPATYGVTAALQF